MAKYGSPDVAFINLGGYDLKPYLTELEFETEAMSEETHTLGDTWVEHSFVGLKHGRGSAPGFYDDEANGINVALVGRSGESRVMLLGIEGNTAGREFVGFAGAMQLRYVRTASRGVLHKARLEWEGDGAVVQGQLMFPQAAVSASSGNSSSVDNLTSSANGASGFSAVSALTLGTATSFIVRHQHSVDNSVWVDLGSNQSYTAIGSQHEFVAGTINRYTRSRYAFMPSAGGGSTATLTAGIARH